ncbi:hypothetical protein [Aneurinibacillus danicus]|uniref:hypothetical protein n=1 Tax=Aneurinibacillus danicus TaxID=267746 RepID=UPI0011BDF018|nr:hypothetical protein [Aneurinibacillus danicus]
MNREQLRALAKEYTRHQGGVFNLQGDDAETCLLIDIIARLLVDCQVSVGRAMYILDEAKKDIANHSVCNIEAGDVESLCRRPSISSHYYLMFSRVFSLVFRFSTIDHPERWRSHVAMT